MDQGIKRRDFFKALAAGSAAALAAGCNDVPEKLIPYLLPPDNVEFSPGNPLEYATTCMECPAACGMVIKTREARAIKAEGNPDHPINQGALCIRGQASLQTLYNPERIASPMQPGTDGWKPITAEAAEKALADKISSVSDRSRIVYMTGNVAGTRGRFLDEWLEALAAAPKVVLEPLATDNIKKANEKTFFRREIPLYQIAKADYLLNFGAEFLETWLNPVEQNRQFAEAHGVREETGGKSRFVHAGPHLSLTGVNADQWVPIRPGSEAVMALALARTVLGRNKRASRGFEGERLTEFLKPYTLERAEKATGIAKAQLADLAREFQSAQASLALAGGNMVATESGSETQLAVNLLNYVAGNIGKTVLFGASRQLDQSTSYQELLKLVSRMLAGEVELLIVEGVNPLYFFPPSVRFAEALKRVGTVVSLSSQWDETTRRAHLVIPGLTFLERWGDATPRKGVHSLLQPVMAPVFPLKSAEDTLLAVAGLLGLEQFKGTADYRDYLRAAWADVQKASGSPGDFEQFWLDSLQRGGVFQQVSFSSSVRFNQQALTGEPGVPELEGEGLALLPTVSIRHREGSGATHPWLQEIPDPVSQVVWDSWADIHPDTGKKLGITHGELIKIRSPYGEVTTAAYFHYGVHRDAIAVPIGLGRTESGRNADLVGVNIMGLLKSAHDKDSGEFAYLTTRVSVEGTGRRAFLVQVDGSPRQGERHIIQTMSLEQVKKKEPPYFGHGAPGGHARKTNMYQPRSATPGYYQPYRWGMVVDVDRCTGCSACVAACFAENNLAVIGKERVSLGREMSWMQIQRFIEGKGDSYRTLMQPMFCQQCGNAGCEPVCPVLATYHTPEGLNAQVYNRCVGTRYCLNNCPYKVRRFNWFQYSFDAPLHMQLNPDVTVRSKGVMEKCTFCIQRIRRARDKADLESRLVRDGEIVPACVQTCPTKALVFGNLSDPKSEVSRRAMREEGSKSHRLRQYEVLEELNNLPAVTYLRKVVVGEQQEEA